MRWNFSILSDVPLHPQLLYRLSTEPLMQRNNVASCKKPLSSQLATGSPRDSRPSTPQKWIYFLFVDEDQSLIRLNFSCLCEGKLLIVMRHFLKPLCCKRGKWTLLAKVAAKLHSICLEVNIPIILRHYCTDCNPKRAASPQTDGSGVASILEYRCNFNTWSFSIALLSSQSEVLYFLSSYF